MAGTIIADKIQTENTFLTLNVGQTLVATINSSGILNSSGGTMVGANGSVSNTAITGVITASQLATSLNLATNNVQVASIQTATGTPAITFAANGQMTLANTPLQLTGGQIKFPGTQIASGDANTLDDYEEGTFTITPTTGTSGSVTASVDTGAYTKIGRLVTVTGYIEFSSVNSPVGFLRFNLPFTVANGSQFESAGSFMFNNVVSANLADFVATLNNNTAQFDIYLGNGTLVSSTSANQIKASTSIRFQASYMTA